MKQAQSALEDDSDQKQDFGRANEFKNFFDDENSDLTFNNDSTIKLRRNQKKQQVFKAQDQIKSPDCSTGKDPSNVLRDMKNLQYSNSKVLSFTTSQKEMTEEESLRRSDPHEKMKKNSKEVENEKNVGLKQDESIFTLKDSSLQR